MTDPCQNNNPNQPATESSDMAASRATAAGDLHGIREELMQLATSAAEFDEYQLAETAGVIVDLLGIVRLLETERDTDSSPKEILTFCTEQAVPVIRSAAEQNDHAAMLESLQSIRESVAEQWGVYLELLSPDERFQPIAASPTRRSGEEHQWEDWQSDDDHRGEHHDTDPSASGETAAVDMALIMSSLNDIMEDLSEDEESHADHGHDHGNGNGNGHDCDCDCDNVLDDGDDDDGFFRSPPVQKAVQGTKSDRRSSLPTPPPTLEKISDQELVTAYSDDARQCLAEMEASLLSLESGQDPDEARRQFCRQLHTLKGASGTVGLSLLAGYLHELESYVESIAVGSVELDTEALLNCVDTVRAQIEVISPGGDLSTAGTSTFSAANAAAANSKQGTPDQSVASAAKPAVSPSGASDGEQFVRVEASRLDRLMDLLAELVMLRNRRDTYVRSLRSLQHELTGFSARTRTLNSAVESGSSDLISRADFAAGDDASAASAASAAHTRLLSRSLLELSNDVSEIGRSLQEVCDPLADDNSAVSHLIGRFRQELMELQRLPIGGLFQRLHRAVRDAARAEGKKVELVIQGQGARVERSLQERLFEPLMHIVRNAVSHGIESPDTRRSAGKAAVGRITLNAWCGASSLFIEISDDGRGLNDELLEAKGRKLGLLTAGQPVSREQLWKLIFHPGFSTRAQVTEISGRGVGMDIVDNWVRRLRGRIDVDSVSGQGTTFRLQIPIRSAIEHAMVVQAGGQLFALPMQAVSGTTDVGPQHRNSSVGNSSFSTTVLSSNTGSSAVLNPDGRSDLSEMLFLSTLLGIDCPPASHPCCVLLKDLTSGKRPKAAGENREIRLAVDTVVGVEEVVVRGLPPLLQKHELFSGVTLSGQADIVLLLDVQRLIEFSHRRTAVAGISDSSGRSDSSRRSAQPSAGRILIADDSVTVRRILSRKLKALGFRTIEAANGADALKLLRAGGVSAVVTDIDMPRMNGLELLQEIRSHRQFRQLPVIVVTSRDDQQLLSRIMECGADEILCKPVTDATVLAIAEAIPQSCPDIVST